MSKNELKAVSMKVPSPSKEHPGHVQWIQISRRLGINSTKVNGFYKYKGTTNNERACYLKHMTDDCWIYFQRSKTQGNMWYIGDPRKGNYAYVVEDLAVPINPTQPLHIWNGREFEDDELVQMQAYDPQKDYNPETIKRMLLAKLKNLGTVSDYPGGEEVFGTLKEHIEQSRPTMDIHYRALMDDVIDKMIKMLVTDVDAVKKTVYKFLGLFIYYFKEITDLALKKSIGKWCDKIFRQCLPHIQADFDASGWDVSTNPQVLVNATLVLRNSMEFLDDISPQHAELLDPVIRACVQGMASSSGELSQIDKEILSGPVYIAAMFDSFNRSFATQNVIYIASRLFTDRHTSNSFKLKLSRLIVCLNSAGSEVNMPIEPLVRALKFSKEGKPAGQAVGDLRWVLWHACYLVKCLAMKDNLKAELIKVGVVEACIEIINTVYSGQDIYLIPNEENRVQAFGILVHLSFCRNLLRAKATKAPFRNILDLYKDDSKLGFYVHQIHWNLSMGEIKKSEPAPQGPILLLFASGDEEMRTRIQCWVQEKSNFSVVVSELQDISSMVGLVDKASIVLLGLSPSLAKSAEARIQAEYADARGKMVVGLNVSYEHYTNIGWLSRFSRKAFNIIDPVELPNLMVHITRLIQEAADGLSPRSDRSLLGENGYFRRRSSGPLWEDGQTIQEIYAWLKDVVQLDDHCIQRFRKSQITKEGFIHLSFLATNNFSDFNKTLSQPEFQFPIGVVLHIAHFFMRDFQSQPRLADVSRLARRRGVEHNSIVRNPSQPYFGPSSASFISRRI